MEKKYYTLKDTGSESLIHPGEMLLDEIESREISVEKFADMIDCEVQEFQDIVECRRPITTEIAFKIEAATDIPSHIWLDLQHAYDYQHALRDPQLIKVLRQIRSVAASVVL